MSLTSIKGVKQQLLVYMYTRCPVPDMRQGLLVFAALQVTHYGLSFLHGATHREHGRTTVNGSNRLCPTRPTFHPKSVSPSIPRRPSRISPPDMPQIVLAPPTPWLAALPTTIKILPKIIVGNG